MEMRRSISVQITDSLNEKDVLPDDFHLEIEEIVDKKWRFFEVFSIELRWISECIC